MNRELGWGQEPRELAQAQRKIRISRENVCVNQRQKRPQPSQRRDGQASGLGRPFYRLAGTQWGGVARAAGVNALANRGCSDKLASGRANRILSSVGFGGEKLFIAAKDTE